MNTDELIAALAADTLPRPTVAQRLKVALPLAFLVCGALFLLFWGPRPDLAKALTSVTVLKTIIPVIALGCAGMLAVVLVHPGQSEKPGLVVLAICAGLYALALAMTVANGGFSGLGAALATPSLLTCLASIPILALPVLGGLFWALSNGAALRPRLAGAAAGLMAGSGAGAIYSLYCDQDAALFVLPAYGFAIASVGVIGALAGPKALRW